MLIKSVRWLPALLALGISLVSTLPSPADPNGDVDRSVAKIREQAAHAMTAALQNGKADAQGKILAGELQSTRIRENAQQEIANIRPTFYGYGLYGRAACSRYGCGSVYGVTPLYGYGPSQILQRDLINQRAADAQFLARQQAQAAASRAAKAASERAQNLQESAINLESQFREPVLPGDAQLQSAGTNLYVRNYGTVQPQVLLANQAQKL
jgi:hypothetical protein